MAQRTTVVLIDDLDGSDATETIGFAVDGKSYEIDLTANHADAFRDAVATFIAHGRRGGGRVTRTRAARPKALARDSSPKAIRAWAVEQGYDVPERGRLPRIVVEAFAAS